MNDFIVLNDGTDDKLECTGYRSNKCKDFLYWFLVFLSCGVLLLIMHWKPEWKIKLKKSRCHVGTADSLLIKDHYGQYATEDIICINEEGERMPNDSVDEHYDNSTEDDNTDASVGLLMRKVPFFRYFTHHHVRYYWDFETSEFIIQLGLEDGTTCASLLNDFHGLSLDVHRQKLMKHGPNCIAIDVKSYWRLFIEEVLNPFYIFQIASITLWALDDYYYYAACIFLISAISISVALYQTRRQSITLRDMVMSHEQILQVSRSNNELFEVDSKDLVPGDLIMIPAHGCVMQCDAVLISGNCIVNESMLTGESVPVTKTPLSHTEDAELYSQDLHKRHTLFCGTHVIQTRYYGHAKVMAVVVRTGFSTAKGELVRAILFPKPMGFKFYQDSIRFILVLAAIAMVGMVYTIVILIMRKADIGKIVLRALDIITIVVPPALPAAMTVGTVYAQNRLKTRGIFCISPPRINVCGKLKLICFDKTGTLTEDGLDLYGVLRLHDDTNHFRHHPEEADKLERGPFLAAMATCHSLTRIDGELSGDPLDMKMFEGTNWTLEEPGEDTVRYDSLVPTIVRPPINLDLELPKEILQEPGSDTVKFDNLSPTVVMPCSRDTFTDDKPPYEIGIVRQFTFSSSLQRMSVITRTLGAPCMDLYCKGAPEKVLSLCDTNTVPPDFNDVLQKYTMQGFRVIGVAWRHLDAKLTWHQVQRIPRDQVECDLRFLGLIIMQNTLKPETTPVIRKLQDANIRTVMVTGDNMLTAVSVARDCEMIKPDEQVIVVDASPPDGDKPAKIEWQYAEPPTDDHQHSQHYYSIHLNIVDSPHYHFAISGRSFAVITNQFPHLLQKLVVRGTVFARMSPDQKAQLVEQLQEIGYCVGMCGDGANDCGALKMAHAGVSLSEAEASVASPFTSNQPNIECIPVIIQEGRAALVTSFGVFKYMALYSMIQFISVLILYTMMMNLSDVQFLYIDLAITTTVAVLMGHTSAYESLVAKRPPGSLLGPAIMFSIFSHILITLGVQLGAMFYLRAQTWYIMEPGDPDSEAVMSWLTTIIFSVSAYQYLILAFTFSKGPPYRKPIWTNVAFLVSLIILSLFTTYLMVYPDKFLSELLLLERGEEKFLRFRLTLLGFPVANFFLAIILEKFVVETDLIKDFFRWARRKRQPNNLYKLIERELASSPDWPPVGHVTFGEKQPSSLAL